jgi:NAD(P)H-hydrate epimerase
MFLTREQVRTVDRRAINDFGVPGVVLMENAARGTAEVLLALGIHGPVVVCCGKGNNGGDGLALARHLDNRLVPVRVLLFAHPEEVGGDAAINLHILEKTGVRLDVRNEDPLNLELLRHDLAAADWVVDALFGTGLTGPLQTLFADVVRAINASSAHVLAVDIPSGLDADTGEPLGATVRAQHTVTFVAPKKGFASPAARSWIGHVHVVDIGAPRSLLV